MSPRIAPRQELEHEYQTDPVRAEIKRVVDCDQLLNHEAMILATMFPQIGGVICISILLIPGDLVTVFSRIGRSEAANIAFSIVLMPSMWSGYFCISLCYLSFWTNVREGRLKRTTVRFLCLFWAVMYGSSVAFIFFFPYNQVGVTAAFGPFGFAILVPLVYTPFRLRALRGTEQQMGAR
jgi:hypothetical protein